MQMPTTTFSSNSSLLYKGQAEGPAHMHTGPQNTPRRRVRVRDPTACVLVAGLLQTTRPPSEMVKGHFFRCPPGRTLWPLSPAHVKAEDRQPVTLPPHTCPGHIQPSAHSAPMPTPAAFSGASVALGFIQPWFALQKHNSSSKILLKILGLGVSDLPPQVSTQRRADQERERRAASSPISAARKEPEAFSSAPLLPEAEPMSLGGRRWVCPPSDLCRQYNGPLQAPMSAAIVPRSLVPCHLRNQAAMIQFAFSAEAAGQGSSGVPF